MISAAWFLSYHKTFPVNQTSDSSHQSFFSKEVTFIEPFQPENCELLLLAVSVPGCLIPIVPFVHFSASGRWPEVQATASGLGTESHVHTAAHKLAPKLPAKQVLNQSSVSIGWEASFLRYSLTCSEVTRLQLEECWWSHKYMSDPFDRSCLDIFFSHCLPIQRWNVPLSRWMNIPLQALLGSNRMDLLIESLNLNFSSSVHSFVSNFLPADCNMRMINRKILLFFFFCNLPFCFLLILLLIWALKQYLAAF